MHPSVHTVRSYLRSQENIELLPFSPHCAEQPLSQGAAGPPTLLRRLTDPTLPEAKRPRFIDAAAGAAGPAGTASTDTL